MFLRIILDLTEQAFQCSSEKKKKSWQFFELKPCFSLPFFFLLNCIFCGEAYIFVSAGDTLIETKINKSAEKLTPTAHSRAWKTRL